MGVVIEYSTTYFKMSRTESWLVGSVVERRTHCLGYRELDSSQLLGGLRRQVLG